jgi:ABC-type nitrate/sulfonate/bicarbonate transport system substrate-binding protein
MDKISFPYRSSSHLVLLHVIAESGAWERYGLDVNYDYQISSTDAHRLVPTGEVEFVGGNHVSTYAHRARGDSWVYLGQTVNRVNTKLVVRPESGINGVSDLHEKVVGTRGAHPGLNDWLYLKQRGLDVDKDEVVLASQRKDKKGTMDPATLDGVQPTQSLWQLVKDKKIDAAFLTYPAVLFAEDAGLKVIDLEPQPMIWFTTISSSLGFVEKHPDIVERFLKGVIEGIHFLKSEREKSINVIKSRCTREGQMSLAQATITYDNLVGMIEPKLYPSMTAIANVYEEAKRQDADAKKINPMELWDMHHVRRIDDSGFIDRLYGRNSPRALDPDAPSPTESRRKVEQEVIREMKACGHPVGEDCGCED